MKEDRITDIQASVLALNLQKENINISGPEINFLDFLNKVIESTAKEKLLIEEISKELHASENFVSFILSRLEKENLVEHRSLEWAISKDGKVLLERCYNMLPAINNAIEKDTFFSQMHNFSKSIMDEK